MTGSIAIVRLSEHYYIENGIYKYRNATYDDMPYDDLFDMVGIVKEDRTSVTFGYTNMQGEPPEHYDNAIYVMVDLSKCRYYHHTDYYSWTDFIFYASVSYDARKKYKYSKILKSTINNQEYIESRCRQIQVLFELNEIAIMKTMSRDEVCEYYRGGDIYEQWEKKAYRYSTE